MRFTVVNPKRVLFHPRARTCKTYAQFKYTVTYLLRVTIANLMQERSLPPPRPRWDERKPAPTAPRAVAVAPSRCIPAGGPPFRFSDPHLFGFSRPKPRTPLRASRGREPQAEPRPARRLRRRGLPENRRPSTIPSLPDFRDQPVRLDRSGRTARWDHRDRRGRPRARARRCGRRAGRRRRRARHARMQRIRSLDEEVDLPFNQNARATLGARLLFARRQSNGVKRR